jgi:hypothetical protein
MKMDDIPDSEPIQEGAGETGETSSDIATEEPEEEQQPSELQKALSEYWWKKPTQECVQSLIQKGSEYYQYITATGKMALWRLCFEQYNRGFITLGSISRGGTEGELLNLPINEFRNIVCHVTGLTTHDKLAFEPQPINNDYTTAAQITLAKGILNDYAKNHGMEYDCDHTAENAYIFGEGSVLKLFNENLGDIKAVDVKGQQIYRNGDVQFITLNPTNLIRDIHIQHFKDNQWFTARIFVNKYDLAAQYPEKAMQIVQKSISSDWDNSRITAARGEKSDLIPMYLAFHKKTSAMPFGRQIFYLDSDCWLEDGHLEYRDFPVYTNMPTPVESINFGYSTAFDLLPLQQVLDIIDGGCATNLSNFLVSNILVPENCNLGVADLIGSMNLLKYNSQVGKPEALNLVQFPKEAIPFRQFIVQRMEVLAGINSTNRGQADEKITSGTMAALYASQVIHFNSNFQKSHAKFCGQVATGVLQDLQDHPEDKRTGMVAGKGNRAYLKEFYGKDVNMIDRVTVQIGSAFLQTDAGKTQVAQDLLASPSGLNPREYLEVLETGTLEPLVEGPHREMMFIKAENEKLAEGGACKAVLTDDDGLHIQEHKNIIADPEMRMSNDPKAAQVLQNTLTHIAEHENNFIQKQQTRPVLMALLHQGQPPPGAPPAPAGHPAPPPGKRPMPGKPGIPAGRAPGGPTAAPQGAPAGHPAPAQHMPISGGMKPTVPVASPATAPAMAGH